MKIAYAAVLLLAGCALQQDGQWTRPDTTEAQWKKDNYECTREATYQPEWFPYPANCWCDYRLVRPLYPGPTGPLVNQDLYEMCLEARGYGWRPERQQ
ncbi:MAG: hypothetical protein OER43_08770 [Gammaproteobacteria bacterium]|nr:hypothetical protein [Gammaproteobacteria bacterium]